ncbi:hypothetical protein G6F43_012046 [Rhizopus delemar]|nr:hypothetical protein G6F43_012046 [Rhizopus delemar]
MKISTFYLCPNSLATYISHRNGIQKLLLFIKNEHEDSPTLDIHQFILKMRSKKHFYFYADRVSQYSEHNYIVKFWAPLFETFLGVDEHVSLHWADTQPSSLKEQGIQARLDMRILLIKHGVVIMDSSNGGYARVATLTILYQD